MFVPQRWKPAFIKMSPEHCCSGSAFFSVIDLPAFPPLWSEPAGASALTRATRSAPPGLTVTSCLCWQSDAAGEDNRRRGVREAWELLHRAGGAPLAEERNLRCVSASTAPRFLHEGKEILVSNDFSSCFSLQLCCSAKVRPSDSDCFQLVIH